MQTRDFTTVAAVIVALLSVLFWVQLPRGTLRSYFQKSRTWGLSNAYLGFAALSLNIGVTSILGKLFPDWNPAQTTELRDMMKDTLGKVIVLILALVFAPIFEELVFRGFLIDGFRVVFKRKLAIAIGASAALFALCHGWTQIPGVFVFGICLGMLRLRSESIRQTVCVHALNNAFGMVMLYDSFAEPSYLISGTLIGIGSVSLLKAMKMTHSSHQKVSPTFTRHHPRP